MSQTADRSDRPCPRSGTAYATAISDAGRIKQITVGGSVKANYTYDGLTRLSIRQTLVSTPSGSMHLIHDVWGHVIAETDGAGHSVREYIWLGDIPVAVIDGSSSLTNPTLLWVHVDHLGRPEMMTDASKAVKWKAVYEPFGTVSSITGAAALQMRFPGQWFQLEAGLAYNWNRHYDSTKGRYTQPDPLGVAAGTSVYGYALQNPIGLIDPTGEATPPGSAWDSDGAKAPGHPGGHPDWPGDPNGGPYWVPNPNPGKGGGPYGWRDSKGKVWCPTGQGGRAHGGPHWDVQDPRTGERDNKYPPLPEVPFPSPIVPSPSPWRSILPWIILAPLIIFSPI